MNNDQAVIARFSWSIIGTDFAVLKLVGKIGAQDGRVAELVYNVALIEFARAQHVGILETAIRGHMLELTKHGSKLSGIAFTSLLDEMLPAVFAECRRRTADLEDRPADFYKP